MGDPSWSRGDSVGRAHVGYPSNTTMVSEVLGRRAQAVEQERAILRCMSVGTVDVRLQKKRKKEGVV